MRANDSDMCFHEVFGQRHVVLPVIHVSTEEQALRNVEIARKAGADGVFLINHLIMSDDLLAIHAAVCRRFAGWWIGVNCLDLDSATVFSRISADVSGVWSDKAMIVEDRKDQPDAEAVGEARKTSGWHGLYLGGVAFKYQRRVDDVGAAAAIAARYMDVVTTSGPGTGHAADVVKIHTMKKAIGDHPLAIASGITPENIGDYLPLSDCYLVATGISRDDENLDPERVRLLVERTHAYDGGMKGSSLPVG